MAETHLGLIASFQAVKVCGWIKVVLQVINRFFHQLCKKFDFAICAQTAAENKLYEESKKKLTNVHKVFQLLPKFLYVPVTPLRNMFKKQEQYKR